MFHHYIRLSLSLVLACLLTACAAPYSAAERETVDNAIRSGDTSLLRGKTRYLYQTTVRQMKVEDAALRADPSGLDHIEIAMYRQEVEKLKWKQKREAVKAEQEKEKQRLAAIRAQKQEEKRLAQELEEKEKREAEEARLLAEKQEQDRLKKIADAEAARAKKIAEAEAFENKIAQPVHAEWQDDMEMLATHFKSNDFEPADRLVDVYSKTMQFLVHASPDNDQFNTFFAKFSDTEKKDHSRMFQDAEGIELLAKFWEEHDRSDLVPAVSSN